MVCVKTGFLSEENEGLGKLTARLSKRTEHLHTKGVAPRLATTKDNSTELSSVSLRETGGRRPPHTNMAEIHRLSTPREHLPGSPSRVPTFQGGRPPG